MRTPPRVPANRLSPNRTRPSKVAPFKRPPEGQPRLEMLEVAESRTDIRVGGYVLFAAEPERGLFEVVEVGDNLVTLKFPRGRLVEVIRAKLRAV